MPTVIDPPKSPVMPSLPDVDKAPSIGTGSTSGGGNTGGGPWKIIVLNDDHNSFEGVAGALATYIPGCDRNKGMRFAETIHNTGRAVVWSGQRETAELYWTQLKDFGLTMAPLDQG